MHMHVHTHVHLRMCVVLYMHVCILYHLHSVEHCSKQRLHMLSFLWDTVHLADQLVPVTEQNQHDDNKLLIANTEIKYPPPHTDAYTHLSTSTHIIYTNTHTVKYLLSFTTLLNTLVLLGNTKPEGTK